MVQKWDYVREHSRKFTVGCILIIVLIIVLALILSEEEKTGLRKFEFVNLCEETVYVGAQGNPLPQEGGWKLEPGESNDIWLPHDWKSGRFWGRTGCVHDEKGRLKCLTGDCPLPDHLYQNNDGTKCQGIGGKPPATWAEFTLSGHAGDDYYDISLVDGFSMSMSISAIGGAYPSEANGKFRCGTPVCWDFDVKKCPPEQQLVKDGKVYACVSVCHARTNPDQVAKHPILSSYNEDQVCCSCGCGSNCGCDNENCKFGCSPHSDKPENRKCYVENWPKATTGQSYHDVFKNQCPDSYSWQFDDFDATYKCKNCDYKIIFCFTGFGWFSGKGGGSIQYKYVARGFLLFFLPCIFIGIPLLFLFGKVFIRNTSAILYAKLPCLLKFPSLPTREKIVIRPGLCITHNCLAWISYLSSFCTFILTMVAFGSTMWSTAGASGVGIWMVCIENKGCQEVLKGDTSNQGSTIRALQAFCLFTAAQISLVFILFTFFMYRKYQSEWDILPEAPNFVRLSIIWCTLGTFICQFVVLTLWTAFHNDVLLKQGSVLGFEVKYGWSIYVCLESFKQAQIPSNLKVLGSPLLSEETDDAKLTGKVN